MLFRMLSGGLLAALLIGAASAAAEKPQKVSSAVEDKAEDAVAKRRALLLKKYPASREIVFKKTPSGDLKLYTYLPPDWKPSDRRPAVLFYHGGGWRGGDTSQFFLHAHDLAQEGFVAFSADYRLKEKEGPVEQYFRCVEDAKSAFRYLVAHAAELGIDPAKIVTMGSSAGAHLAIAIALLDEYSDPADDLTIPTVPAAVILACPVVDCGPKPGYEVIHRLMGHEAALRFCPMRHLRPGVPPQLICLGTKDHILSEAHAREYLDKARSFGGIGELKMYEGAKHAFIYAEKWYRQAKPDMRDFLTRLGLWPTPQP